MKIKKKNQIIFNNENDQLPSAANNYLQ